MKALPISQENTKLWATGNEIFHMMGKCAMNWYRLHCYHRIRFHISKRHAFRNRRPSTVFISRSWALILLQGFLGKKSKRLAKQTFFNNIKIYMSPMFKMIPKFIISRKLFIVQTHSEYHLTCIKKNKLFINSSFSAISEKEKGFFENSDSAPELTW